MASESNSWISFNEHQLLLMLVHELLTVVSTNYSKIISKELDNRLLDLLGYMVSFPIYYDK